MYQILFQFRKAIILKNDYSSIGIDVFLKYFKALCQTKRFQQLFEDCLEFDLSNTDNIDLMEIYCEAFCQLNITDFKTIIHDVDKYYDRVLQKKEDSLFGQVAKAISLLIKEDYVSCRVILFEGKYLNIFSPAYFCWIRLFSEKKLLLGYLKDFVHFSQLYEQSRGFFSYVVLKISK